MNHEENKLQESNSLAACICERREEEEKERGRGGLFMQQSWHRREAMRARGRARHRAGDRRPTAVLFVCTGPASEWQSFLTVLSAAGISARSSECLDAEHTCWLNVMEKTSGTGRRCSGQHSRLIEGSGFDSHSGSCLWHFRLPGGSETETSPLPPLWKGILCQGCGAGFSLVLIKLSQGPPDEAA